MNKTLKVFSCVMKTGCHFLQYLFIEGKYDINYDNLSSN